MKDHLEHTHPQSHKIYDELMCHWPYAVVSICIALILLAFVSVGYLGSSNPSLIKKGTKLLFHTFHFMHIVFATTGSLITFYRFSQNIIKGLIVGTSCAIFFCLLSDAVLPYIGGLCLGVDMKFHLCFLTEFSNVFPFLVVGMISGLVLSRHHKEHQQVYALSSHFGHILISSLASSFFLVSHGFFDWYKSIGLVFIFLILAVVVPCTLSDVVVPMWFAKNGK